MNNKFTYFDDLDIFLVRAKWSHKKHEKYFVIRENILNFKKKILVHLVLFLKGPTTELCCLT